MFTLSARVGTQTIPAGRPLDFCEEQMRFAVLVSGILRISRQQADGRRQIIGLFFPGDLIEFSQVTDYVEIEAATDARICSFHRSGIADLLASSHDIRMALLAARQQMADRMRAHVWVLGALNPAERIALFLASSCSNMPWQPLPSGGRILTMQLPRADIADYLGTTVETLCRVIGKLDETGLIKARDHRHFEIPDLSCLRHFGRTGQPIDAALGAVPSKSVGDDGRQCNSAGTALM
jgi:CRP/FNR family transcriptional regulator